MKLLENGYDIRTVQELLGHKSVQTTYDIYPCHQKGRGGCAEPAGRALKKKGLRKRSIRNKSY